MKDLSSLQSMKIELRQSQQHLLDVLNKADEHQLYRRLDENEWTLAENLVHVAEAREFFVAETRKALADPGARIGRTINHPERLQNILDHGQDVREGIAQHLVSSHTQVIQLLEEMSEEDLQKTGMHVKYGLQTLAEFIEHFIIEHDQLHVKQAFALLEEIAMIEQEPTNVEVEVSQLYNDMHTYSLQPLWKLEEALMLSQPQPKVLPWLWKWEPLFEIAQRSGRLVPIERGGDRRAIALANPGLNGQPFATQTLWAAVQWLNGHEVAPAHRHTAQAMRFIIDGNNSWSTVEGDRVFLERGDLVLTAPWLWHDHGSRSDKPAIWMDGLDIPLNNFLDASFFEPNPHEAQEVTKVLNGTVLKYGVGQLRPSWEKRSTEYPPMHVYKWADTERALNNLAQVEASLFDDVALEYINPHSGGSVMPTFACSIQMLRPGVHTQAHRHVGSSVYHVFEGSGETIINGQRFQWRQGDFFVVPGWAWHEHSNSSQSTRALLFSLHDTPVQIALHKYREETYTEYSGRQPVTGVFEVGPGYM